MSTGEQISFGLHQLWRQFLPGNRKPAEVQNLGASHSRQTLLYPIATADRAPMTMTGAYWNIWAEAADNMRDNHRARLDGVNLPNTRHT